MHVDLIVLSVMVLSQNKMYYEMLCESWLVTGNLSLSLERERENCRSWAKSQIHWDDHSELQGFRPTYFSRLLTKLLDQDPFSSPTLFPLSFRCHEDREKERGVLEVFPLFIVLFPL